MGLSTAVGITVGFSHTCAVDQAEVAWCWGENGAGQLGVGDTTDEATPEAVIGFSNAVAISAGSDFTCAVQAGGSVWCWGQNSVGQLGNGGFTGTFPTPAVVVAVAGAVGVTAGENHACALLSDYTAMCWGMNGSGQLGDGSTTNAATPLTVMSPQ